MGHMPPKTSEAQLPSDEISVRACVLLDLPRLSSDSREPQVSPADAGSAVDIPSRQRHQK